ncbi:MAG: HAD family phosphatase [Candidatus Aenigmarchaeota archaeon]|nr:HAD family phosphatase [Candidatus Aenigmarchaeota archaeon]
MIKCIIFDWGNVIKFYDNDKFRNIISRRFNIDKELFKQVELKHRLKNDFGKITTEQYIEAIENELGIDKKEYSKLLFSKNFSNINKDLIKIIKNLKKNYKIFVLSNNNESAKKSITSHKIEHLFDKILFSYEVKIKKPDPRFFRKLLKGTKLKLFECVFIDDREDNVIEAMKLGMKGIIYTSNKKLLKDLKDSGISIK